MSDWTEPDAELADHRDRLIATLRGGRHWPYSTSDSLQAQSTCRVRLVPPAEY